MNEFKKEIKDDASRTIMYESLADFWRVIFMAVALTLPMALVVALTELNRNEAHPYRTEKYQNMTKEQKEMEDEYEQRMMELN